MPLNKSKSAKAFKENVETEMDAGKPKDQSLAIAYDVQRRSKNKKKMAEGGIIDSVVNTVKESFSDPKPADKSSPDYHPRKLNTDKTKSFQKGFGYADGGQVEGPKSVVSAIRAKMKKMAEGGQVDIEDNGDEDPNMYYDLNEAALKENYDEDMMDVTQPEDSNEHGDSRESAMEDEYDMVKAIRSKMRQKRMSEE